MIRSYYQLPDIPSAGPLTRYADTLGVIVPLARTNLVLNPLLKNNSTGWTALNANSTFNSGSPGTYFYGWGATVQPSGPLPGGGTQYGLYYTIALTSGVTYAVGVMFRRQAAGGASGTYALAVATTGGVDLITKRFTIPLGVWQWQWLIWTETSTTNRRIIIRRDDLITGAEALADLFYISGLQVESCADGYLGPTTYIDGDRKGLVPNQYPPAYGWNGTPHASTSYRTGQTRAGGKVVRFRDLGFLLTAIIGLGMAPPAHQALTFAQLDGGQYQNTLKPPRQFSITGRWATNEPNELDASVSALGQLLDRDLVAQRQPFVLTTQAQDCGVICGEPVQVQALYSGGLEGDVQELPSNAQGVTFANYLPMVIGPGQGQILDVQDSVSNANDIIQRSNTGVWSSMLGGATAGASKVVRAIAIGPDGSVYAGGDFDTMGSTSNTSKIAKWDPVTGIWTALGTGITGGSVFALAFGPDGTLYVGGNFTTSGGVATANISKWNGSAWSTVGTSGDINAQVSALVVDSLGNLYAGGAFTNAGGIAAADQIAKWNGSAWASLGVTGLNNSVESLAVGLDGTTIYLGGNFTDAGGVADADRIAYWNGTAYAAMSTGANSAVYALFVGRDARVYAGGAFTTIGGVSVSSIAVWNGTAWTALGSGVDNLVRSFAQTTNGLLYVGGDFTTANGIPLADHVAIWDGATWLPVDVDLPGSPQVGALAVAQNTGVLYVGYTTTGTATAPGTATAQNSGTAAVYPRLTITGPASGTSRIYQIANTTTGRAIYMNYTINAGETAVLTFDPTNVTFVSSFRGNILNTILPGSQTTSFVLQPGNNTISFFAASSTVAAALDWQMGYASLNDALRVAVP